MNVHWIAWFETILTIFWIISLLIRGKRLTKIIAYIVMLLYIIHIILINQMFQELLPYLTSEISARYKILVTFHSLIGFYALIVVGMQCARSLGRSGTISFFEEYPKKALYLLMIWLISFGTGLVFYWKIY